MNIAAYVMNALAALSLVFSVVVAPPGFAQEAKLMENLSEVERFVRAIEGHPELVKRTPDEMALSFPVPIKDMRDPRKPTIYMAFFYYFMNGFPPGPYKISPPMCRTVVDFKSQKILSFKQTTPDDFGIQFPVDQPVGEYTPPSGLTMEAYSRKKARFFQLYDRVLQLFGDGKNSMNETDKTAAREFSALFEELAHRPLLPFYRAMNPAFFQWLESGQ